MTLYEKRAKAIHDFVQKFIAKAKKHKAVFIYDGDMFAVEDIEITERSFRIWLSNTCSTTFFDIDQGWDEMLEQSVEEMKKHLKNNLKLYKEIK
jgi:hypothetical protein